MSLLTNLDLSTFDTGHCTDMSYMFNNSPKLQEVTLGDKFAFVGNDGYLPAQTNDNILGADGNWYIGNSDVAISPEEVHKDKTIIETYYAIPTKVDFVAVQDITGVPTEISIGENLTLNGKVTPSKATNKNIVWTVKDAGTTGASINNNILNVVSEGTLTITATILNGATESTNYTKDFTLNAYSKKVQVTIGVAKIGSKLEFINDATVEMKQGNKTIATVSVGNNGMYVFDDMDYGNYTVVATHTQGSYPISATESIRVTDTNNTAAILFTEGNKQTIVDVKDDSLKVSVSGLNNLTNNSILKQMLTSEEMTAVETDGFVEIKLVATPKQDSEVEEDKNKIQEIANGKKIDKIFDLSLLKTVKTNSGNILADGVLINSIPSNIAITIELDEHMKNKEDFSIYRVHNGQAEELKRDIPNANGEYYVMDDNKSYVQLNVKNFSNYAIAYSAKEVVMIDGGTGSTGAGFYSQGETVTVNAGTKSGYKFAGWTISGATLADTNNSITTFVMPSNNVILTANWEKTSSSEASYYTIFATAGEGGNISTADKVYVPVGDSAGFTFTPDKGYQVADVLVNGKSIGAVSSYVFTNVRSDQTISVTFKRASGHSNPSTSVSINN